MLTLSDPRQTLVSTFMQQVTYEVGSVPAALHLEIQGIGNAFDQVQTEITITGFDAAAAVGTPASPGTSTGTHLVVDGNGPVALIGGIVNMRVTANLRITVTLSSRYALSGDRNFVFQYSLL